jgi:hypothetical protein
MVEIALPDPGTIQSSAKPDAKKKSTFASSVCGGKAIIQFGFSPRRGTVPG